MVIGAIVFFQFNNKTGLTKVDGKVTIGKQIFDIEVVRTDKDKQIGLTKYQSLKAEQGMLFLFDQPAQYGFWMKNMKFPIDIIFINGDTVVTTFENVPAVKADNANPPIYKPDGAADKVFEISSGLVKKYGIKKGDKVKIEI